MGSRGTLTFHRPGSHNYQAGVESQRLCRDFRFLNVFLIGIPALLMIPLGAVVVGSAVGRFLWPWHKNRPVEITDIHDANV